MLRGPVGLSGEALPATRRALTARTSGLPDSVPPPGRDSGRGCNHGGAHVSMAKELLDRPDVVAVLQEVRRE